GRPPAGRTRISRSDRMGAASALDAKPSSSRLIDPRNMARIQVSDQQAALVFATIRFTCFLEILILDCPLNPPGLAAISTRLSTAMNSGHRQKRRKRGPNRGRRQV